MKRDIVISSQLTSINDLRYFLESVFNESNLKMELFNRVFLGLSEAVNNSIVHGNKFDQSKTVKVIVNISDTKLFLEIHDEGDGFSSSCIEDPTCLENLRRESGRGIFLMHHLADGVTFFEGGRKVLISFKLS